MEAELGVGFQLFSERYVSRVTLDPVRSVTAVASETMLFSHLVNIWRFETGPEPGSTWLDFGVEFQFRSHLYAAASQLFFEEVVVNMVSAFEKRCLDTYKQPQWSAFAQKLNEKQQLARGTVVETEALDGVSASKGTEVASPTTSPKKGTTPQTLRPGLW